VPDRDDNSRIVFYATSPPPQTGADEAPLPDEYRLTVWRPTWRQWTPPSSSGVKWLVWALFHYAGIFASPGYSVIQIRHGAELVHRSPLFPRYFRFPFMQRIDLQVGDTWTHPRERGRGLAVVALQRAAAIARSGGSRLWYLTTSANIASIRVAERAGLTRVGAGTRRRRFGVALLGEYRIETTSGAAAGDAPSGGR
jgi:RimJ/RimL family protein N-acetyltransferase